MTTPAESSASDAMPPNRVVLAGAKRAQQAYDLSLPGRPAADLTVAAPEWDSLDAEEQGEWLTLARVVMGVES